MFNDISEIDAVLSRPIQSSNLARWERKKRCREATPMRPNTSLKVRTSGGLKTPSSSDKRSCKTPTGLNLKTPTGLNLTTMGGTLNSGQNSKAGMKQYSTSRFIPNRDSLNLEFAALKVNDENIESSHQELNQKLAESLFDGSRLESKVLAFRQKPPVPMGGFDNDLAVLYTQNRTQATKRTYRHISSVAERILDAPDLLDDYYLNLLDWSSLNVMAVGLGSTVYLWDAKTGAIESLCDLPGEEHVTSIKWMQDGSYLAVGTSQSVVQLWNVELKKQVRSMKGHQARVGCLSWNSYLLSSGSRDSMIIHHDVRVAQHHIATLKAHQQEVCGLDWSTDGTQLASGGNDNMCYIWDSNDTKPRFKLNHAVAAVKALAWCPWERNVLATGAGTADRHIRFYNTLTGSMLNSIDTKSQVCSLNWSIHEKELLSGHGFSQNQLTIWKYPSMAKVAELTGHTSRVLHTSLSPDGTTVVSAGADETLRIWNIWQPRQSKKKGKGLEITACNKISGVQIR